MSANNAESVRGDVYTQRILGQRVYCDHWRCLSLWEGTGFECFVAASRCCLGSRIRRHF